MTATATLAAALREQLGYLADEVAGQPRLAAMVAALVGKAREVEVAALDAGRSGPGALDDDEAPDWAELEPRARAALARMLREGEDREVITAAKAILDRALGKVPQRVEHSDVSDADALLDSPVWRFVLSIMAARSLSMAEAEVFARQNPEAVAAWWQRQQERRGAGGLAGLVEVQQLGAGGGGGAAAPPPGGGG